MKTYDGIAYREAGPSDGPPVLLVHGFPESSYMWRQLLPALGDAGRRAIAPDLPGSGDSPPDPPGTWERQVEALERFRRGLGIERTALVVHDWGGLIGLRWACDHPEAVDALVISNTGFFADGQWHGLAQAMRTPETGEEMMDGTTKEALAASLRQSSPGMGDDAIDEYWKGFADGTRRRGHLELYRSGDFEKLEPYKGRLGALGVPALILWGARDEFAPVAGAHRFKRELADAELIVIEEASHFVFQDEPERTAEAVTRFLSG
jgi:haloalkane dehalogenase